LPEWLYERGIGENRAALVEGDHILEAEIELPGQLAAGSIVDGRLTAILIPGRRGIVGLASGGEALLEPLPLKVTEGAALRVEIVRSAVQEAGRSKLPKARIADGETRAGPDLLTRIRGTGLPVLELRPVGRDRLEDAGWSQVLEEAEGGKIPFEGGSLLMSLTPAMTLFDVDGWLEPRLLAIAGAAAAARAIRRFGIGGSIGIDLPTLAAKDARQAAAAALDAELPQPFERTAVNGFGFLQVVRRRERPSLPEILQIDPAGAAARALLRRAERIAGGGERTIHAAPVVIRSIAHHSPWIEALERRIGAPLRLREDPSLAISAGHVQSQFQ
jgi:hypothetical protein